MVAGHFGVELADGAVQRDISVLLVHVVVSSSGLVAKHDSEGFNVGGSALKDFVDGENLSLGTLGLELPSQMVPEFRFSNDFVPREKSDGIDFGVGILLSGQLAAQHEVLSYLSLI